MVVWNLRDQGLVLPFESQSFFGSLIVTNSSHCYSGLLKESDKTYEHPMHLTWCYFIVYISLYEPKRLFVN